MATKASRGALSMQLTCARDRQLACSHLSEAAVLPLTMGDNPTDFAQTVCVQMNGHELECPSSRKTSLAL